MAEETLVKETLTQEMVDSGMELARALLGQQIELTACFWLYSAEANDWKLAVSFPQVDTEGPKKAYETIQTIQSVIRPAGFRQSEPEPARFARLLRLYLDDITVLGPSHRLVRSVLAVPLDPDSPGVRFKRSRLGDSFFDDVYVYNLRALSQ